MSALSLPLRKIAQSSEKFLFGRHGNGSRKSNDAGGDVGFSARNGREVDDELTDRVSCMTLHSQKRHNFKLVVLAGKRGSQRNQQKTRVAKIEKQLRAKWALEDLIEEQLARFNAHYNQPGGLILPRDVPQILMPEWATPLEMASLGWMGDWRPSSILELLHSLARLTSFSFSASSSDQVNMDRILSQLIREIRVEETVLDEEMGEIQSTCILQLPFGPVSRTDGSPLEKVLSEFKKIERVLSKAQKLRFKVLELIVKKVLNPTDAAEFLVMFAAIQDSIRQFCVRQMSQKLPVSLPTKCLERDAIWEPSILRRCSNIARERSINITTNATSFTDL